MTARSRIAIAVLAIASAACSSDDDSDARGLDDLAAAADDAPPCTDMFAPGRPTTDVVAQYDKQPCTDEAGDMFVAVIASWDCGDGIKVHVVDPYGWGRTGDVWQGPDTPKPPSTNPDGAHEGCP